MVKTVGKKSTGDAITRARRVTQGVAHRRQLAPGHLQAFINALQDNPTLGSLLQRWRVAQQCMQAASVVLGAQLAPSLRPGPVEDAQWTLLASSGTAASKARQLLPRITEAVQSLGLGVETVRIRVSPPVNVA